jgi:hypothetical protein
MFYGISKCGCPIFEDGCHHKPENHSSGETEAKPPSRLERAASALRRLAR